MDSFVFGVCLMIFNVEAFHYGRANHNLKPYMPNVCAQREVALIAQTQPCVQAFSRTVRVWKQSCSGQAWCMGYERRTAYYTAYRQVYTQDFQTVYKCCPGWSQLNGEAGCLYRKKHKCNNIHIYSRQMYSLIPI
uniref:EMI domain-containing protein n=1 Tax=Knipowitschia caucasica TaxID=637954 RepID=A0AAV2M4G7_KNICA